METYSSTGKITETMLSVITRTKSGDQILIEQFKTQTLMKAKRVTTNQL